MRFWGIVVAAGAGRRFGAPKHAVLLGGVPLWERAQAALRAAGIEDVTVVGDVPGGVPGGRRRQDSVAAGLSRVPPDVDAVLVHDAARPLASAELVRRVMRRIEKGDVDAVVPVVEVRDTLKEVDDDRVLRTVSRARLAAAQTPQAVLRRVLQDVLDRAETAATDEAGLVEGAGGVVAAVPGDPRNLKITHPEDLAVAAALLAGDTP